MSPRRHTHSAAVTADELAGWFAGRIPEGLYTGPVQVSGDVDETIVVGPIADVELAADATDSAREAARRARIARFREETRAKRMEVAREAEHLFGRTVSWGVECGGIRELFTTLGLPMMTRLRLAERQVLDTLVDAGVARSRSEALAWSVRLVGKHQKEWIDSLREALGVVEKARAEGPNPAA